VSALNYTHRVDILHTNGLRRPNPGHSLRSQWLVERLSGAKETGTGKIRGTPITYHPPAGILSYDKNIILLYVI